jgi:SAM-dependent methyltransferase
MSEIIHRRDTCRLCQSRNLELVFQLAPSPIGDAYVTADQRDVPQPLFPIDLYLCRDCGLAQLLDVIAPEVLYGDYIYVTSSSLGLGDHFRAYAQEVCDAVEPPPGSLVVDIGSNDGTLLGHFEDLGMRVIGVEPAEHIAQAATAAGRETVAGFFTPELAKHIRERHGRAAIVTANNVFANVDDLEPMMRGIRELLAEEGVFVCESYYVADVVRNMVFDFIYHEHISSFAVTPLHAFFQRMGMRLLDVTRVPTKGGSLRYTVGLANGPRQPSPRVAAMLEEEKKGGVCDPKTFRDFSKKIDQLRRGMLAHLDDFKSRGMSIAGFGASITATTLIYHFGIGGYLEYLIDDNPAKQGRFSPGLHLPVYPASALYDRKPDIVVVLAWRYAEPFIHKHRNYLANGGQFLIPVPEVRIIKAL